MGQPNTGDSVYDSDAGFLVALDWTVDELKNPWISYQMETLSDQIDRDWHAGRQTLSREVAAVAGGDNHLSNDENSLKHAKSVRK